MKNVTDKLLDGLNRLHDSAVVGKSGVRVVVRKAINRNDSRVAKEDGTFECSECGGAVTATEATCPHCGADLGEPAQTSDKRKGKKKPKRSDARVVEADGTYTCSECGGVVSVDDEVCPHCGATLDEPSPEETNDKRRPKRSDARVQKEAGYVCSECGADVGEDDEFCASCGADLGSGSASDNRVLGQDGITTCSVCGGIVAEEDVFCPHCGVELDQPDVIRDNRGVTIHAAGNYPKVGDRVTVGRKPAKDGKYAFTDDAGKKVQCFVKGGKIELLGDSSAGTATRRRLQDRSIIAKARKSANDSHQQRKLKSFVKGKLEGTTLADGRVDISKVDLVELGDAMYEAVFGYLADRYELTEAMVDSLETELSDKVCKPVVDGNRLKVVVPVWNEMNDEVDLKNFDLAELTYELSGSFDSTELIEKLTDSELQIQTSLIV